MVRADANSGDLNEHDEIDELITAWGGLRGRRALDLPEEQFRIAWDASAARAMRDGIDGARASLAVMFLSGLHRVRDSEEADLPGWANEATPLELVLIGGLGSGPLPEERETFDAYLDAWLDALDQHGANDRISAFADATARVARHSDEPDLDPMAAVLIEAVEDELTLEPLPRRLEPASMFSGGAARVRPPAGYQLPRPIPPSARPRRVLQGEETFPDGSVGALLQSGAHLVEVRPGDLAITALAALAAACHPELLDDEARLSRWLFQTPKDTGMSDLVDLAAALGEHATVDDLLRHALGAELLDRRADVPTVDIAPAGKPYGPRSRHVPTSQGKRLHTDDPSQTAELRDAFSKARREFVAKFGREPGPDDPVFFDPDADEPVPIDETRLADEMEEILRAAGIRPEAVYATEANGGLLLTEMNQHLVDPVDRDAWIDAATSYQTAAEWIEDGDPDAYVLVLRRAAIDLRADELRAAENISSLVDPADEYGFEAAEQWLTERAARLDPDEQTRAQGRAIDYTKGRLADRTDLLALVEENDWSRRLPSGPTGWWALAALAAGVDTLVGVVDLDDLLDDWHEED
jgi:hypothetical protein